MTEKTKILVDAGIKLGKVTEFPKIPESLMRGVEAIVISHNHLDHTGYLPHIYSAGYKGKVYGTKPTIELTTIMLSDYINISAPKDVTDEGMERLRKSFKIVEFRENFKIGDLSLMFYKSGHVLGSAMVSIRDKKGTLLYTGDLNMAETRLLEGADLKGVSADTLIMEATYGSKKDVFPPESVTVKKMLHSVNETLRQGGKVLIPSFAVGNAEQMLLMLDDYMNSGVLQKVPIYVDGMINKAMRIHRHNVIYAREELQKRILMSDFDPFKSENFVPVEKNGQRTKIVNSDESCIIVTTSGMISGGPILFYLAKLAHMPENKLLQVGYQAAGTIGRQLQEGAKEVTLNGNKVKVNLKVETYHFSAHADRPQLESLLRKVHGLKKVFLVHGEESKLKELKHDIENKFNVNIPVQGEVYDI